MKKLLLIVCLLLALRPMASAQVASATLLGEVRDESGGLAPAATVTARHSATGFVRTATANSQGEYRIDELLPGDYTVTAEKSGFRAVEAKGVRLEVNQKARFDLVLKVGEERGSITVEAQVSPVQSDDASIGYRLETSAIDSLPLVQRNVVNLVTLGPGAIPRQLGGFVSDQVNSVQANRGATALNPPINGARSYMNAFILDGANDTDRNTFAIAVEPPMESVQEFRIQTSAASAEFSQAAGGIMDVVTKSGSLAWHGSAFEYFRNEALDAHNYFDDPALPRPIFRQSQFGGSLGGPVPKAKKTFFFATYEGLRAKSGKSMLALVPDATLRTGDFTGRSPIYNPFSLDPATGQRLPFAGNVIPQTLIDPIASKFLSTYEPLPNRNNPSDNFLDSTPSQHHDDTVSGRIDHEFSNQSRLFARYTINDERGVLAGLFPELPDNENLRAQQATIGHTHSGANWLNEARLNFTRLKIFDTPQAAFNRDLAGQLGLQGLSGNPANFGLPYFLVEDFSTVTDAPNLPQLQRDNLWQFSDGFSLTRGRHTFKTGFQWMHYQVNYLQSNLPRGQYIFTGAFTATGPNNTAASGDALADFLLGLPQVTNRTVGFAQSYLRQNTFAGYFQDDWRVRRDLTLNFGVRYEYFAPFTDARNQLLNLDYSTLPEAPRLVSVGSANQPNYKNFAPRAGLAWTPPVSLWPGRKMVFRAGYGIYFAPEISTEAYNLVLNNIRTETNQTDGVTPLLTIQNGFPQTASTGFPTLYGLDQHAPTAYVQQWNASIQQELPAGILFEAAYIGSKGTDLGLYRRFNTPAHVEIGQNLPPRPGDLQSLRTFPELGPILQVQHIANSSYNSLQLKATKHMGKSLYFLTSFVWSKSIDDADLPIAGLYDAVGAQDERNLRLERGLSFFNVGRRLSSGYVYNLPSVGPGFSRLVTRNWQTSGIVTIQDGTPENVFYFATDIANSGTFNRPNIVPGQSISLPRDQRTPDHWFNTSAFSQPASYTFGNAGRDIIPGPGNIVFDLALSRRFHPRESQAIEFRAEFFNTFNYPNFGIPVANPDFGPFFGKIIATGDPRRIQLALRYDF
ncbi:MAG TPA: carboxypeptidase regulatory-like domain-containing protein [Bryobacteraceae bacterium]|nr:carboxypeptidase regulatory-like domain-containing protein [Bryobacteraceae bacterium]